jgi:predicted  nucleic acid-binding Zn-ribbon protein
MATRIEELREHLKKLRSQRDGLTRAYDRAMQAIADANKQILRVEAELPTVDRYIEGTQAKLKEFGNIEQQEKQRKIDELKAQIEALSGQI